MSVSSSPSTSTQQQNVQTCLFCDKPAGDEQFRKCETLELDLKVRKYATTIGDADLLRKLSVGDLVAIDACYHLRCLVYFEREATAQMRLDDDSESKLRDLLKAQAFSLSFFQT